MKNNPIIFALLLSCATLSSVQANDSLKSATFKGEQYKSSKGYLVGTGFVRAGGANCGMIFTLPLQSMPPDTGE